MNKKFLICSLAACACLFAAPQEAKDSRTGWINYEQNSSPQQGQKTEKQLLEDILKEQKKQTQIQEKMLEIMLVTNDLPREVVVNGKKCLSNSSEECFVMPIIGDGARIPVMKQWLENPTVENALAYYKWQSKYLNHIFNVGYSLEFASKSTENPFANVPSHLSDGTNSAATQREKLAKEVISSKYAKNMEISILIGRNFGFDTEYTTYLFRAYDDFKAMGIKTRFIFENQESLNTFAEFHKKALNPMLRDKWASIPKESKVISPNTFRDNKIDVHMTPMFILRYNDIANSKAFSQIIGVGRERPEDMQRSVNKALILFGVVKPTEFSGTKAQKYRAEEMIREVQGRTFINDEEGKRMAPAFIEMIERGAKNSQVQQKSTNK
ncbi:hypothetical protein CQA49_00870 [Helicobacter sp. MIT 00-7814]|uniref:hypothetical protein n=1 Tax=unclassified Helicobacter TaxID=2593540 RepID=UPI000E1E875E|nr:MULTISPECIES: hypothetical protein [unclassified Helicobacter]RDU55065.1 hypothetical protein CQA37_04460 [Helicobacter sp. MIT 99-10781]RDU56884.1 hypothetical protein CQA49_00870 [Helicobacter sp. MIT 00-7814]